MRYLQILVAAVLLAAGLLTGPVPQETPQAGAPATGIQSLPQPDQAPLEPKSVMKDRFAEIDKLVEAKDWAAVLLAADETTSEARASGDKVAEAQALMKRGEALWNLDLYSIAVNPWDRAASMCGELGDVPGQVEALSNAALCRFARRTKEDSARAEQCLTVAVALAQADTRRPRHAAQALARVAHLALEQNWTAVARPLSIAAIPLLDRYTDDPTDALWCRIDLAGVRKQEGDTGKMREIYAAVLGVLPRAPDSPRKAQMLMVIGADRRDAGDLDEAASLFTQALDIRRKMLGNSGPVAENEMALGDVRYRQHREGEGEPHFQRALKILRTLPGAPVRYIAGEPRPAAVRAVPDKATPQFANCLYGLGLCALNLGRYTEAYDYLTRALPIYMDAGPDSIGVVKCRLNRGNASLNMEEFVAAQVDYEAALSTLRRKPHDPSVEALCLYHLGDVADRFVDLAGAQRLFGQALAIQTIVDPKSLAVAKTEDGLGQVAKDGFQFEEAREHFDRALSIRREKHAEPEIIESLINLGNLYDSSGDPIQAARSYSEADAALAIRGGETDPNRIASLSNLSNIEIDLGDYAHADAHLDTARQIADRLKVAPQSRIPLLTAQGNNALSRGDLLAAEQDFESVLRAVQSSPRDAMLKALVLNDLANCRIAIGTQRLKGLQAGDPENNVMRASALHWLDAADADNGTAIVLLAPRYGPDAPRHPGDFDPADYDAHRRAQSAYAFVGLGLSTFYRSPKDGARLARAEHYLTRASILFRGRSASPLDLATALGNLGAVRDALGSYVAADAALSEAETNYRRLAPSSLDFVAVLVNHGKALEHLRARLPKAARYAEPIRKYTEAISIVEAQRGLVYSRDSRRLIAEEEADPYIALSGALVAVGRTKEALIALESARGRSLSAAIRAARSAIRGGAAPDKAARERSSLDATRTRLLIQREWLANQTTVDSAARLERIAQIDSDLRATGLRARTLDEQIGRQIAAERKLDPGRAAIEHPPRIDADAVEAALDPGTLVLDYLIAEDHAYLFTIHAADRSGRKEVVYKVYPVGVVTTLSDRTRRLYKSVTSNPDPNPREAAARRPIPFDEAAAADLYGLLVSPAGTELASCERLLIIPDGMLWRVPFCALRQVETGGRRRYLIEERPIHYAVSIGVYAAIKQSRREAAARRTALAFGDPAYPQTLFGAAAVDRRLETHAKAKHFAALSGQSAAGSRAQPRAEPMAAPKNGPYRRLRRTRFQCTTQYQLLGMGGEPFFAERATPSAVFQQCGAAFDVPSLWLRLHFAVHFNENSADPFLSHLALAPEHGEKAYSGPLSGYAIMDRLRLRADLVTIAACSCGAGQPTALEGAIGIPWAFQYAGARSVVAAQWITDTDSSSMLFCGDDEDRRLHGRAIGTASPNSNGFYGALTGHRGWGPSQSLVAPQTKDEAVRTAQLDMIHGKCGGKYAAPFYWAGYALQGDYR
ncbi:MAG TPA: CHAT domain-containing protein [Chthonomonadaceae bacterium]|nr:CHAT domain-containing protein [Chthonomonadaceae bacterium]